MLIDLDAFDYGPNDLATCLPIGLLYAQLHLERELLYPPDEHAELAFDLGFVTEALRFSFQLVDAFAEAAYPRRKFGFLHEALCIAVDQARDRTPERAHLRLDLLPFLG